jgi:hypothetical protein
MTLETLGFPDHEDKRAAPRMQAMGSAVFMEHEAGFEYSISWEAAADAIRNQYGT